MIGGADAVQARVLGGIDIQGDNEKVRAAGKELVLVAVLALAVGRSVPAETLARRVWGESLAINWRPTLHTYVNRLRRRLEEAGTARSRLSRLDGGYALDIAADDVDWVRFSGLRSHASAAVRSGDEQRGLELLDEALSLWWGAPLPGVEGRWAEDMRTTMREAHQSALVAWAKTALRLGRAEEVAGSLAESAPEYPLNEALCLQRMRALQRCGRPSDALAVFERFRQRLATDTGADPGPQVLRTHEEILRAGGGSGLPHGDPRSGEADGAAIQRNLPRDLADFSGRRGECESVISRLQAPQRSESARICVVSGMPGVGKTSLAVHCAHRLAGAYSDGCWMVELRGHSGHQAPVPAHEALAELLEMAGIPPDRMGATLGKRIAAWRDYTAHRRILIVLDDAADAAQVVPLLPSGAGCGVIVTSRQRLSDIDGADHCAVSVPAPGEAEQLFRALAPEHAREAASDFAIACGGLPLAMRLVAARLRRGAPGEAASVAARLRASTDSLGEFRAGPRGLEAAFAVSLRSLSPDAQAAFALLGLHPLATMDEDVAAALCGLERDRARTVLDELVEASLLEAAPHSSVRFHDLIHSFAYRSAAAGLHPPQRRSAIERMLHAYLDMAGRADALAYPDRLRLPGAGVGSEPSQGPELATRQAALEWLHAQTGSVAAIGDYAARHGWQDQAALLSHLVAEHVDAHGPWDAAVELHRRAWDLWQERGDRRGRAHAAYELARVLLHTGDLAGARRLATEAAGLWQELGDRTAQAWAVDQQGLTAFVTGSYAEAVGIHQRAQELFERLGDRRGIAVSLDRIGTCLLKQGRFHEALAAHSDALRQFELLADPEASLSTKIHQAGAFKGLALHREASALLQEALAGVRRRHERRREAIVLCNSGDLAIYRGEDESAFTCLHMALDIHREVSDPWTETITLNNLGRLHLRMRQLDEAERCLSASLHLCASFPNPGIGVESLLGLAEAALERDRPSEAQARAEQALAQASRDGLRYEGAQASAVLGRVLTRQGVLDEARRSLEKAARELTDLGSPDAEYVRLMLESWKIP